MEYQIFKYGEFQCEVYAWAGQMTQICFDGSRHLQQTAHCTDNNNGQKTKNNQTEFPPPTADSHCTDNIKNIVKD